MNHALEDTSIIYNKNNIIVSVPLTVTHVDIIDKTKNKLVYHNLHESTVTLKCKENTLYYIDLYNNEDF